MFSHIHFTSLAGVVSLFAATVFGEDGTAACADLITALPGRILRQGEKAYVKENSDYYNAGLKELLPSCIAMPRSAKEVSTIVKILNKHEKVPFAIKSGGHDPNPGQSSVHQGVLIALKHINGTEYDAKKRVAHVKPGGHWSDVLVPLIKQSVTVVSGRLGLVGIGGYLMQGGISFLSAQHGMAADSILEYEMVLANGTIATISQKRYPDLVRALRGGGDQFGIATKFTLQTYPCQPIWGGLRVYAKKDREAVFAALADFVENNHKDPKAAMIYTSGAGQVMMQVFYNGTTPPPGAFRKFESIKPAMQSVKTMPYSDLIGMSNFVLGLLHTRTSFRSITLPHVPTNPRYYLELDNLWSNITARRFKGHPTVSSTLAFQPFPRTIGKATQARGGNSMGLTASDHDRFIIEIAGIYRNKADDELVQSAAKEFTTTIKQQFPAIKSAALSAGVKLGDYNPDFANDAGPDQEVTASYRDVAKFTKLQRQMDPNGLFAKRAGVSNITENVVKL